MGLSDQYSGIVINQNAIVNRTISNLTSTLSQTFTLPDDFDRAGSVSPALTGFSLFVIPSSTSASYSWAFSSQNSDGTWTQLADGITTGVPTDLTPSASTGAPISPYWMTSLFTVPLQVESTGTFQISITAISELQLQGTTPNPIIYGSASETLGSLAFRVLATTADSGVDFLGNTYRSVAVSNYSTNVSPIQTDDLDAAWLSSPCPSGFGVECMYFDMRDGDDAVVLDRVTIDPYTPGVTFTVYYSSDPTGPGTDANSWDQLLWTPVYASYKATRKLTWAFPKPFSAKYVKIEFSNLQARSYTPSQFQLPTVYRKYPAWVVNFFQTQLTLQNSIDLISTSTNVVYDLLDLAYTYYQGDTVQAPDVPTLSQPPLTNSALSFLQNSNTSNQVDPGTLSQIQTAFQPYVGPPTVQGDPGSLLTRVAQSQSNASYSVEVPNPAQADTTVVSNLERESLLIEKAFPQMFFYIPSRHYYRTCQAMLERNIAYFAGVNTIAFHRDVYTGALDHDQYNEILQDNVNVAIDDAAFWAEYAPITE